MPNAFDVPTHLIDATRLDLDGHVVPPHGDLWLAFRSVKPGGSPRR